LLQRGKPAWIVYTDLASPFRYLKPKNAVVREKVEAIWIPTVLLDCSVSRRTPALCAADAAAFR
jgi:hypothetical protein